MKTEYEILRSLLSHGFTHISLTGQTRMLKAAESLAEQGIVYLTPTPRFEGRSVTVHLALRRNALLNMPTPE